MRTRDGGGFGDMGGLVAIAAVQQAPAQLALGVLIVGAQRDRALVVRVRPLPALFRQQRVGKRQMHVCIVRRPRQQVAQQHGSPPWRARTGAASAP